jgi:hypothetical protein
MLSSTLDPRSCIFFSDFPVPILFALPISFPWFGQPNILLRSSSLSLPSPADFLRGNILVKIKSDNIYFQTTSNAVKQSVNLHDVYLTHTLSGFVQQHFICRINILLVMKLYIFEPIFSTNSAYGRKRTLKYCISGTVVWKAEVGTCMTKCHENQDSRRCAL